MCTPSHPCGGAIVEDAEFRALTGRRMVRCFGGGHTLMVEGVPEPLPGAEKRCRWCHAIITKARRRQYCNDRCLRRYKKFVYEPRVRAAYKANAAGPR
jgi:hypothetical protein